MGSTSRPPGEESWERGQRGATGTRVSPAPAAKQKRGDKTELKAKRTGREGGTPPVSQEGGAGPENCPERGGESRGRAGEVPPALSQPGPRDAR